LWRAFYEHANISNFSHDFTGKGVLIVLRRFLPKWHIFTVTEQRLSPYTWLYTGQFFCCSFNRTRMYAGFSQMRRKCLSARRWSLRRRRHVARALPSWITSAAAAALDELCNKYTAKKGRRQAYQPPSVTSRRSHKRSRVTLWPLALSHTVWRYGHGNIDATQLFNNTMSFGTNRPKYIHTVLDPIKPLHAPLNQIVNNAKSETDNPRY